MIKIFFAEHRFASGARCTPRDIAHTRLPGPGPADHVTIITRPGTGQKFGALESARRDEHDVVAGVLRAGGAIWRTAHSRAHRFVPVSLSLFLSCVRSPSSPSLLSFSLVPFLSVCPCLSLFLSVQHVLLRSAGSFLHSSAASSTTSGPGDEEGPSGPIYPHASCDDPVDGFQKFTETVLN